MGRDYLEVTIDAVATVPSTTRLRRAYNAQGLRLLSCIPDSLVQPLIIVLAIKTNIVGCVCVSKLAVGLLRV